MAQSTKSNKKQNKQQNKKDKQSHKKKTTTKGRSSICPYLVGSFVLIGAIAGAISYDVHTNGGGVFEKSSTGKFLKDTGALPYVEIAWYKSMSNSARAFKWLEKNVPVYYETSKDLLKPYGELAVNLGKVTIVVVKNVGESFSEFINQKAPAAANCIDQYVPGLSKKIGDFSALVWSSSADVYQKSCDFFKTKVFVGSLSPESLSKVVNETQIVAAKYYSWFHEKVDAYAKIK